MKLTAVIKKSVEGGYIGQIKELPGVLTQGETVDETRNNLMDALDLWLEDIQEEQEEGEVVYIQDLELHVG